VGVPDPRVKPEGDDKRMEQEGGEVRAFCRLLIAFHCHSRAWPGNHAPVAAPYRRRENRL